MNKIFRVIWSRTLNVFVVVSELATGRCKSSNSTQVSVGDKLSLLSFTLKPLAALFSAKTITSMASAAVFGSVLFASQNVYAAIHVTHNNNSTAPTILLGGNSVGPEGVVVGYRASAKEEGTALGNDAKADARQSVAVGWGTRAKGSQSTALGNNTFAGGHGAIAIGGDDVGGEGGKAAIVTNGGDVVGRYNSENNTGEYFLTSANMEDVSAKVESGEVLTSDKDVFFDPVSNKYFKIKRNDSGAIIYDTSKNAIREATYKYSKLLPKAVLDKYRAHKNSTFAGVSVGALNENLAKGNSFSNTWAEGKGAIAMGARSVAYGDSSVAIGTMSFALGDNSSVFGSGSFAFGNSSQALGNDTYVYADNSVGLGSHVQAIDKGSMAFGHRARSGAEGSITIGTDVYAGVQMDYDAQISYLSKVNGQNKTVQGRIHRADNDRSSYRLNEADGILTFDANGSRRVAGENQKLNSGAGFFSYWNIGYIDRLEEAIKYDQAVKPVTELDEETGIIKMKADAKKNSIVIGSRSASSGSNNILLGRGVFARDDNSIAIGSYSYTLNKNAIAIGLAAHALGQNTVVLGVGSVVESPAKNSTVVGSGSFNKGSNSSLFGAQSSIWGDDSLVLGNNSSSAGPNNIILGNSAKIDQLNASVNSSAENSIVIGHEAQILIRNAENKANMLAIGNKSKAYFANSTAIGYESETDYTIEDLRAPAWTAKGSISLPNPERIGIVSVGRIGGERRISNVAAGYRDTDAANVSQLKRIEERIDNLSLGGESNSVRYFSVENKLDRDVNNLNTLAEYERDYKSYLRLQEQAFIVQARENRGDGIDPTFKQELTTKLNELKTKLGTRVSTDGKRLSSVNVSDKKYYSTVNKKRVYNYEQAVADVAAAKKADEAKSALTDTERTTLEEANFTNLGAKGKNSIAVGYTASATNTAETGIAMGYKAQVTKKDAVAIGRQSQGLELNAVAIGASAQATKDSAVALGASSKGAGEQSTALGNYAETGENAKRAIAAGYHSLASGEYAIAIGSANGGRTTASQSGAIALGSKASASVENAMALGTGAAADQAHSVALGSGATTRAAASKSASGALTNSEGGNRTFSWTGGTTAYSSISVGKADQLRQIHHVAAGDVSADSTDAINGSQLYALANTKMLFAGNTGSVGRLLGETLTIRGKANSGLTVTPSGNNTLEIGIDTAKAGNVTAGTGITLGGNANNRLLGTGNLTVGLSDEYKNKINAIKSYELTSDGDLIKVTDNGSTDSAQKWKVGFNVEALKAQLGQLGATTTLTAGNTNHKIGEKNTTLTITGTDGIEAGLTTTNDQTGNGTLTIKLDTDTKSKVDKINTIESSVNTVKDKVNTIETKVNTVENNVSNIERNINTIETKLGSGKITFADGTNTQDVALGKQFKIEGNEDIKAAVAADGDGAKVSLVLQKATDIATGGTKVATAEKVKEYVDAATRGKVDEDLNNVSADAVTNKVTKGNLTAKQNSMIEVTNGNNKLIGGDASIDLNAATKEKIGKIDTIEEDVTDLKDKVTNAKFKYKSTNPAGAPASGTSSSNEFEHSLSSAFEFVGDKNIITKAEAGKVSFALQNSLTGINSITGQNGTASITFNQNDLTINSKQIKGVNKGTDDKDVATIAQLKDLANKLAGGTGTTSVGGDGSVTTPTFSLPNSGTGTGGTTTHNNIGSALTALDTKLGNIINAATNQTITYYKDTNDKKTVKLTDGLHFQAGSNLNLTVAGNGSVLYGLSPTLTDITSISGGNNTLTFMQNGGGFDFGGKKLTGVSKGTTNADAVNYEQLKALADAMGAKVGGDGTITKPTVDISVDKNGNPKDGSAGTGGVDGSAGAGGSVPGSQTNTVTNIGDAIGALDKALANSSLSFTGDAEGTVGKVKLRDQKLQIAGTDGEITTSTTENGQKLTIALHKNIKDAIENANKSGDKDLGNLSDKGKEVITGLVTATNDNTAGKGSSFVEVTETVDQATKVKTIKVGIDETKLEQNIDISYKSTTSTGAEKATGTKSTKLSSGFNFQDTTNISAEVGDTGLVKFSLNKDLTGIDSIAKADGKSKISLGDGSVTLSGDNNSTITLTGVAAGKGDNDAINKKQLSDALAKLGGGAGVNDQGNITGPTYTLDKANSLNSTNGTAGTNGAVGTVGAALLALDGAIGKLDEKLGNTKLKYKAATENDAKEVALSTGLHFQSGDSNLSVATEANGVVKYTLSNALTGINSIEKGTNGSKISLGADAITLGKGATGTDAVKLTGLADGAITADSKDAVTGHQLSKLATALGLTPKDNGFDTPTFTNGVNGANGTNGQNPTSIKGAIDDLIAAVNRGLKFSGNKNPEATAHKAQMLGSTLEIKAADVETAFKGTNLKTEYTLTDGNGVLNIGFKEAPTFTDITANSLGREDGKSKITLGDKTVTLSSTNATNGTDPVTLAGIANGKGDNDAVTVKQLEDALAKLGGKTTPTVDENGNVTAPSFELTHSDKLNKPADSANNGAGGANSGTGGATGGTGTGTTASTPKTTVGEALSALDGAIGKLDEKLDGAEISYKANNDTDSKKVSLKDGFKFTNGTNTTAAVENNGVVKFNLNEDLAGISSIEGKGTTNKGKISFTADSKDIGFNGGKLSNIADGAISSTSTDAISGKQLQGKLKELATALGGKAAVSDTDGSFTKPSFSLKSGKDGAIGETATNYENVGSALDALDKAIAKVNTTSNDAISSFEVGAASSAADKLTLNKTDKRFDIIGSDNIETGVDAANKAITVKLSKALSGLTSATFGTDNNNKTVIDKDGLTTTSTAGKTTVAGGTVTLEDAAGTNKAKLALDSDKLKFADKDGNAISLTNIKDGVIGENSTDAVTGKQLSELAKSLGLTPNTNNGFDAPTITNGINGADGTAATAPTTITGAINDLIATVNKGLKFSGNSNPATADHKAQMLGSTLDIKADDIDAAFKGGNLTTKYTLTGGNGTLSIGFKEAPTFTNITADSIGKDGKSGITFNDGKVTLKGAAAGSNAVIEGVANGSADNEAVTAKQLKDALTALGGGASIVEADGNNGEKKGDIKAPSFELTNADKLNKPADGANGGAGAGGTGSATTGAKTNVSDALKALDGAIGKLSENLTSAKIKYKAGTEKAKEVELSTGLSFTPTSTVEGNADTTNLTISTANDGVVNFKLNDQLKGLASLEGKGTDTNKGKISFTADSKDISVNGGKLTSLADGAIGDNSTDAVTGKQLSKLATALGLDPNDNSFTPPTFTNGVNGKDGKPGEKPTSLKDAIDDLITAVNGGLKFGGNHNPTTGHNAQALGSTFDIKAGETVDGYSDSNLTTKYTLTDGNGVLNIGFKAAPTFTDITANSIGKGTGKPTMTFSDDAITLGKTTNGKSEPVKLTGVAAGKDDNDAINAKQLSDVLAKLANGAKIKDDGTLEVPTFDLTNADGLNNPNAGGTAGGATGGTAGGATGGTAGGATGGTANNTAAKGNVKDAIEALDVAIGKLKDNLTNATIAYKSTDKDGANEKSATPVSLSKGFDFRSTENITSAVDANGLVKFSLNSDLVNLTSATFNGGANGTGTTTTINKDGVKVKNGTNETALVDNGLSFKEVPAAGATADKTKEITISRDGDKLKLSNGNDANNEVGLSNLKGGEIAKDGKDAATSGQLYDTAKSVADNLGGGATVGTDGKVTKPEYHLTTATTGGKDPAAPTDGSTAKPGKVFDNVGEALTSLDSTISTLKSDSVSTFTVKSDETGEEITVDNGKHAANTNTVAIKGGKNITTKIENKEVVVDLDDSLTGLTTVEAGTGTDKTTLTKDGVTTTKTENGVAKEAKQNADGFSVKAGDKTTKVTADGVENEKGLELKGGKDGADGAKATTLTVNNDGVTLNDKKVTGLVDGAIGDDSKDAVTGKQLKSVLDNIKASLGAGTVDPATGKVKDVKFSLKAGADTATEHTSVKDALGALDGALTNLSKSSIDEITIGADATKDGVTLNKQNKRIDVVGSEGITTAVDGNKITVKLDKTINDMEAVNFDAKDGTTVAVDQAGMTVTNTDAKTGKSSHTIVDKDGLSLTGKDGEKVAVNKDNVKLENKDGKSSQLDAGKLTLANSKDQPDNKKLVLKAGKDGGVIEGLENRTADATDYGNGDNAGRVATEGAVKALADSGLKVNADQGGVKTHKLGKEIAVVGATEEISHTSGNKTINGTADNIVTKVGQDKDGKTTIQVGLAKDIKGVEKISLVKSAGADKPAAEFIVEGNGFTATSKGATPDEDKTVKLEVGKDGGKLTGLEARNTDSDKYGVGDNLGRVATESAVKKNRDDVESGVVGNLVYTDNDGNRLAKADDGNYYKSSDVTAGKANKDAKAVDNPVLSLTNAKGRNKNNAGEAVVLNNVQNGEVSADSKQVVNGSQIYQVIQNINNSNQRIDNLQNQVNTLSKDMRSGVAQAIAQANLPVNVLPGKSTLSVAAGSYMGTQAVAVGYSRVSDSGKVSVKFSMGHAGNKTSVGAGFGYSW